MFACLIAPIDRLHKMVLNRSTSVQAQASSDNASSRLSFVLS